MNNQPIRSRLAGDPGLANVIASFANAIPGRVQSIRTCVEKQDTDELCKLIHQLKGVCGSYGFDAITPLAIQLEKQLEQGVSIETLRPDLEAFLECCLRITSN